MARAHLRTTIKDGAGNAIQNALVHLREHGTTNAASGAWSAAAGGTSVASVASNAQGEVEAWLDTPRTVDLLITDNSSAAYLASSPGSLKTFASFVEVVEVFPAPEEVAVRDAITTANVVSSVHAIDLSFGASVFDLTLTTSTTFSFSGAVAGKVAAFSLFRRQNATGGHTSAFPATVRWSNNVAPTLSSAPNTLDVLSFISLDGGSNWYGFVGGLAMGAAPVTAAPGAPTIATAVGGNGQATANWTAPGSNGGSAITGYVVKTYRASDNVELFSDTVGVVLSFVRTGLTNDVGVYFKVAAVNAVGTGAQSAASNTVTPAGFNPAGVPGVVDWVEADQLAGPPADNAALASVTPSVGAHTYTQATGTKQPTFRSSVAAWNNKPVMRFVRANSQEMATAAPVLAALDNYTIIAVCSLTGTGAASAVYCNGQSTGNGYSIFAVSGQAAGKVAELVNAVAWHDTNINSTTAPVIIMVRRTSGVTRIWVNGVEGTVTQASDGPLANITDSTRIGSSPSTYHDGDIAAVFAANASVSVANLNALGNYWGAKYGIAWTTIP